MVPPSRGTLSAAAEGRVGGPARAKHCRWRRAWTPEGGPRGQERSERMSSGEASAARAHKFPMRPGVIGPAGQRPRRGGSRGAVERNERGGSRESFSPRLSPRLHRGDVAPHIDLRRGRPARGGGGLPQPLVLFEDDSIQPLGGVDSLEPERAGRRERADVGAGNSGAGAIACGRRRVDQRSHEKKRRALEQCPGKRPASTNSDRLVGAGAGADNKKVEAPPRA